MKPICQMWGDPELGLGVHIRAKGAFVWPPPGGLGHELAVVKDLALVPSTDKSKKRDVPARAVQARLRVRLVAAAAHQTAADHGVDIAARDADVGKLAGVHGAELTADKATVVPCTKV